jgi:hypothetical protein
MNSLSLGLCCSVWLTAGILKTLGMSLVIFCHIQSNERACYLFLVLGRAITDFLIDNKIQEPNKTNIGITWEKAANLTYPVLPSRPPPILWEMIAVDRGERLITSRDSWTFWGKHGLIRKMQYHILKEGYKTHLELNWTMQHFPNCINGG